MSTHMERHRAEMKRLAYPVVEDFVARNPRYSITSDQSGSQSATNYVIFGQHGDEQVVFKYFCEDERKEREVYALRHFAATGLVPHLLVEDGPRLIVQSHIPGRGLIAPQGSAFATVDTQRVGYTLGQAVAALTSVPLSPQAARAYESTFYDGLPLEQYIGDILAAAQLIHQNVPAYGGSLFAASLASIKSSLDYLLAQPRLLYHQDALNMHFVGSDFAGFFDLEMCRVGTEAMQIGSLWYVCATYDNWRAFAQGFAKQSSRKLGKLDFYAAQAFAHFLVWRYISRSGRWHGDLLDAKEQAQEETHATEYANSINRNNQIVWDE